MGPQGIPRLHGERRQGAQSDIAHFRRFRDTATAGARRQWPFSLSLFFIPLLTTTRPCDRIHLFTRQNCVESLFYGEVAQLVEQGTENPRVGGSIPFFATISGPERSAAW